MSIPLPSPAHAAVPGSSPLPGGAVSQLLPAPPSPLPLPHSPTLARMADLLAPFEAEAQAAHTAAQQGFPRGPHTGLPTLDRALGGHLTPGLHILHGSPGSGKTALGGQVAATCGMPALQVSVEMAPLTLFRRHVARQTSTRLSTITNGTLPPA